MPLYANIIIKKCENYWVCDEETMEFTLWKYMTFKILLKLSHTEIFIRTPSLFKISKYKFKKKEKKIER